MASKKKSTSAPFESIVVAVDLSRYSRLVVRQAEKLARELKLKLILAHAFTRDWRFEELEATIPPIDIPFVKKTIEKYYHVHPSDSLNIEVRPGDPAESILKIAEKYPAPLIIVGSQGKNAVSRYILGSQAEKIALKSSFPVWVHRGNKIVPFKKILVPTDLSPQSREQIHQIKDWAQKLPLSLKYLYVEPRTPNILPDPGYMEMAEEVKKINRESLRRFRKEEPSISLTTLTGNEPSLGISRFAKDYDVIAMNPHLHSGLRKKFGKVTSKVIRMSDAPVLVVKS